MADHSKIEWTDATWNVITGCSVTSPGCKNCYAMKLAGTRLRNHPSRAGLTRESEAGPVWIGEVRFNEQWLMQPWHWTRPRMIFVCAHGDLFHEAVPDEWIDKVFAVMARARQHTFQVLTKRTKRMREYLTDPNRHGRVLAAAEGIELCGMEWCPWPLPNVWIGASVEDQKRAGERIPDLLAVPAAIRWISAEPLLGPIKLRPHWLAGEWEQGVFPHIDWVVAGGESGANARPMHPDWVRSLRDQCAAASVPFLFKQWGEYSLSYDRDRDDPDFRKWPAMDRRPGRWINLAGGHGFHGKRVHYAERIGKKAAGRLLDGRTHDDFPRVTQP